MYLNKVYIKILKAFTDWKQIQIKENKNKERDNFDTLCDKTIVKLMNVDFKQDSYLSKIKSSIFQRIKADMKSINEFEFDF